MEGRLIFSDLAAKFGIKMEMPGAPGGPGGPGGAPGGPGGPGAPGEAPAGPMVHANVWSKEAGQKALEYIRQYANEGERFEYDGHADCWLMLAIMYELRMCDINSYIGVFGKTLSIKPYSTGSAPADGQPCTFSVEEKGEDVLLTVHLEPDKNPFDMPFSEIIAPELPDGKNIYVRLDGRHLLFVFPLPLVYGERCRSIVMDYSGECFVSVSNTPELSVGDKVENPF